MKQVNSENKQDDDDDDEDGKGSSGSESPKLKPNIALLLDSASAIAENFDKKSSESSDGSASGESSSGKTANIPNENIIFGAWQYHHGQLMLYNQQLHKKLMLESLDTPTKLLKVIVGLGVQKGWDTENLIKTLDAAATKNFNKPLYHLISQTKDTATIQWKKGTLTEIEPHDFFPKSSGISK